MSARWDDLPRGDVAVSIAQAHAGRLYRRAREIRELAALAQECAADGPGHDIGRAERTLARIAALAGGGSAA